MSTLISVIGFVFLISGFLSLVKITDAGLDFVSKTQIHTLPFLSTFPVEWVYIGLGLILLIIAGALSRR